MSKVAIVMGSKSDAEVMQNAIDILDKFGIASEIFTISAHRTPEKARQFASSAREQGFEVVIAGAGYAAHLPGVIASWTTLPVIGVPLASSDLNGLDSLYAIVQMPAGIPVATVTVGKAGAKNAAYLAAEILSLKYSEIENKLKIYREELASS
ncbi:MAG: 5-(carboxyamino)imidazole ribonucleotide mutase [Dehalococcoidales bacterium]|nr:5-(carboxyamino)imidazole ribonucleotide mutase [Dehalococcoidales bacterium]MDD3265379.1 5-(carboxyamino)imidazole ribonucleotide mutase [Dehalococcoidales bacterium]MDD4322326.1 5-(carboxyamino)imidazole ribonucleotide mutase [Dehalococcoidales bacterium]MDD4793954.1 5-(carboxyamino)imidazole ribonucleotide mutase [Dehalococcoidales bacterium]MDD5122475.1 5-(carboxyamino)imidazole ribonucleotide mutase [Dehalococcoidales bacterium]